MKWKTPNKFWLPAGSGSKDLDYAFGSITLRPAEGGCVYFRVADESMSSDSFAFTMSEKTFAALIVWMCDWQRRWEKK